MLHSFSGNEAFVQLGFTHTSNLHNCWLGFYSVFQHLINNSSSLYLTLCSSLYTAHNVIFLWAGDVLWLLASFPLAETRHDKVSVISTLNWLYGEGTVHINSLQQQKISLLQNVYTRPGEHLPSYSMDNVKLLPKAVQQSWHEVDMSPP